MSTLDKVTNPTRFDMAPRGTIWKHGEDLWIQFSNSTDHGTAEWIPGGVFALKVLRGCVLKEDFIKACLNVLDGDNLNRKANLDEILKGIRNELESSDF